VNKIVLDPGLYLENTKISIFRSILLIGKDKMTCKITTSVSNKVTIFLVNSTGVTFEVCFLSVILCGNNNTCVFGVTGERNSLIFQNCFFTQDQSVEFINGSCIYFYETSGIAGAFSNNLTFQNCEIISLKTVYIPLVYLCRYSFTLLVNSCAFYNVSNNGTSQRGGCINCADWRSVILANSSIRSCDTDYGTFIYCERILKLEIRSCLFVYCLATIQGGGLSVMNGAVSSVLENNTFLNCYAEERGGGVYFESCCGVVIMMCEFLNCTQHNSSLSEIGSYGGGGIIFLKTNETIIINCPFRHCIARVGYCDYFFMCIFFVIGGGIFFCAISTGYIFNSHHYMENCIFVNNSALLLRGHDVYSDSNFPFNQSNVINIYSDSEIPQFSVKETVLQLFYELSTFECKQIRGKCEIPCVWNVDGCTVNCPEETIPIMGRCMKNCNSTSFSQGNEGNNYDFCVTRCEIVNTYECGVSCEFVGEVKIEDRDSCLSLNDEKVDSGYYYCDWIERSESF
jgi:hypothetical protein